MLCVGRGRRAVLLRQVAHLRRRSKARVLLVMLVLVSLQEGRVHLVRQERVGDQAVVGVVEQARHARALVTIRRHRVKHNLSLVLEVLLQGVALRRVSLRKLHRGVQLGDQALRVVHLRRHVLRV